MMLASKAHVTDISTLQAGGHMFDLKIDGIRCLASVTDGIVTLTSRQGVTLTSQYPEVEAALRTRFPSGHWVFDGEISVNDERGLPSWPRTLKRNAQTKHTAAWAVRLPATFYAFDILVESGAIVRAMPFEARRGLLASALAGDQVLRVVLHTTDGEALWNLVIEHGLEGMVAKRQTSIYRNGRSTEWVKIKRTSSVTALVGGFDPDLEGKRPFRNLHLYLVRDGMLTPIGHVGSGFSEAELREVAAHLQLRTPTVVEVEYLDVSPDGHLRQPVFTRLRTDAGVVECAYDQIDA